MDMVNESQAAAAKMLNILAELPSIKAQHVAAHYVLFAFLNANPGYAKGMANLFIDTMNSAIQGDTPCESDSQSVAQGPQLILT